MASDNINSSEKAEQILQSDNSVQLRMTNLQPCLKSMKLNHTGNTGSSNILNTYEIFSYRFEKDSNHKRATKLELIIDGTTKETYLTLTGYSNPDEKKIFTLCPRTIPKILGFALIVETTEGELFIQFLRLKDAQAVFEALKENL